MKKLYNTPIVEIVKVETAAMMEELGGASGPAHPTAPRRLVGDIIE